MPHLYYVNRWYTIYASIATLPILTVTHLALLYIPQFRHFNGHAGGGGQMKSQSTNGDEALDEAKRELSMITGNAPGTTSFRSPPNSIKRFLMSNLQWTLIVVDVILAMFLTGTVLWLGISEVAVENWHVVFGLIWCLGWCTVWFLDLIRVRDAFDWVAARRAKRASVANRASASKTSSIQQRHTPGQDAQSSKTQRDHYSRSHQNPISTLTKRSNRSSSSSSSSSDEDEEDSFSNNGTVMGMPPTSALVDASGSPANPQNVSASRRFLSGPDLHKSTPSDLHWTLWYFETIKLGIQERIFFFIPLFVTALFLSLGVTLFVERTCICIHPQQISTRITRMLQGVSCQPHKVCFNYLTLPEKPAEEMIVKFHASSVPLESAVYYDTVPRFGQVEAYQHMALCHWIDMRPYIKDEDRFIHSCDLTSLTPNTTYYFITTFVEQETSTRIVENREMKFKTQHNSPSEPVRFAVSGDRQSMSTISKAILHQATLQDISFFVLGGDLVYDNGMIHCYRRWDKFFREYEAYGNYNGYYIPLLASIGNHEGLFWQFGVTPLEALNYVQMISHKVGDTGLDRKLNHIHLLGQHSTLTILDSGIVQTHQSQVAWMDNMWSTKYANTNKLVAYHAPMYPSSRDFDYIWGSTGRKYWEPLFDKYNVTVGFEHHDHLFKRTKMLSTEGQIVEKGGTIYLGDGSMGISRPDPVDIPVPHFLAKRGSRFHFWLVDIARDWGTYRAIDHYGETFDILNMEKNANGEWKSVENVLTEEER
eukprot:CAMPEP_0117449968 /NCGR_PEP_ID=MMETSP0759-20121206/8222_1 /TAXON_ID=63605 /ORGANISM="Percolomonas cosmopolitus, Strain WS" /LENGTH=762 /DNA_ID=CAMNT_0005242467 /DNA_START=262 /DNA_END=2547 /DNA_ORIENTATION=-